MKRAAALVLAVMLLFAGAAIGEWFEDAPSTLVHTVTRTVMPDEYRELLEDYELEAGGLRGFIEGIEERPPEIITRVDTVVAPPDTVLRFVTVDARGRLNLELLSRTDSAGVVGYVPELRERADVSDCDEGFSVTNGRVVCDRARFGHLYAVADAGFHNTLAGLDWEPSYRSAWQFTAGRAFAYHRADPDTWEVRVRRRVRLW